MKLPEYSIVSRWVPIALLFVAVAIGGTLVQLSGLGKEHRH